VDLIGYQAIALIQVWLGPLPDVSSTQMTTLSVTMDAQVSLRNDDSQRILLSVLLLALRRAEVDGLRSHGVAIIPAVQEANDSTSCASESRAAFPVVSHNPFLVCFLYCSTVIANDFYHNHTSKNLPRFFKPIFQIIERGSQATLRFLRRAETFFFGALVAKVLEAM